MSRRGMVAATGGVVAAVASGRVLGAQPEPTAKPDKAPDVGRARSSSRADNPSVGKPVSVTAAASDEPTLVPANPKKLRLALVGLGKLMVGEILPAIKLSSLCEVTALVTANADKGRAIADTLGLDHSRVMDYARISEMRNDETIDALYIATPNSLHARDTIAGLKAGKHVLCEKPLASTIADAEMMVNAAKENGRQLMTAYRVHHEPLNLQMKKMIKERKYGKPMFVAFDTTIEVGKKPQYRLDAKLAGGGSLFDIGIYSLNTTRFLLGEEPIEVSAMQWNDPEDKRFDEVEQNIAFQLRFPSGCIANCTSSYGTARVNRYRVICQKGWMGMEPATEYRGLKAEHCNDEERVTLKEPETVNQFAAQFDAFAKAILENKPVAPSGEDGLKDMRLMVKIYEAAASGRAVKV